MRIMVTGGAGFIGSQFIKYTLQNHPEDSIINYDVLTYAGNLSTLRDVETNPQYSFIKGDIANRDHVEKAFALGVDTVVNFAAESHVDRSILDPESFVRTNVLGTQVLLDVAWQNGVQKFVQVSTDEVYGSLAGDGFFTEKTPLKPNSPYSASKASADLFVRAYSETYGINVNITRCSNNYGPYQFPEKLIPLLIINAISDRPLPIYGDGLQIRDWLHVWDHCAAINLVLRNGRPGEVYNIGGHNEHTNKDVALRILEILGKPTSLLVHVKDRPGHDRRYAIDPTKINTELGWRPTHNFQTGIDQTIRWYLGNEWWWRSMMSRDLSTQSPYA